MVGRTGGRMDGRTEMNRTDPVVQTFWSILTSKGKETKWSHRCCISALAAITGKELAVEFTCVNETGLRITFEFFTPR